MLVPDLATDLGKISNGGKTYTFKIKQGVKFGPPLNRQITSADFKFAIERIKDPKIGRGSTASTSNEGCKSVRPRRPGIKTPSTDVVFNLTKPTATSATASACRPPAPCPRRSQAASPRPPSTAASSCRSGPYMIAGSDKLNASSCDKVGAAPSRGFDGEKQLSTRAQPRVRGQDGHDQGARELP